MDLSQKFAEALTNAKGVASNSYLTLLSESVMVVVQRKKADRSQTFILHFEADFDQTRNEPVVKNAIRTLM